MIKKGFYHSKKGIADVLITVLIIFFGISAVAITGGIIINQVSKAGDAIEQKDICIENKVSPIACSVTLGNGFQQGKIILSYQRKSGDKIMPLNGTHVSFIRSDGQIISTNGSKALSAGEVDNLILQTSFYPSQATIDSEYYINSNSGKTVLCASSEKIVCTTQDSTAPIITQHPVSQEVPPSNPVSLSVSASGTEPLSYQWYFNNAQISGATSNVYSIANMVGSLNGNYYVRVRNGKGTAFSNSALISINYSYLPPSFLNIAPTSFNPPFNATLAVGERFNLIASFTVYGGPNTYQWYKNGQPILGNTTYNLSISNLQLADTGNYSIVATNAAGSNSSNQIRLFVQNPPLPNLIPTNITINFSNMNFSGVLSANQLSTSVGANDLDGSIQLISLYIDDVFLKACKPIFLGRCSISLSLVNFTQGSNHTLKIEAIDDKGASNSTYHNITIVDTINITSSSLNQSIIPGTQTILFVNATGYQLTYQWFNRSINATDWSALPGATNSILVFPSIQASDAGIYQVRVYSPAQQGYFQAPEVYLNASNEKRPLPNLSVYIFLNHTFSSPLDYSRYSKSIYPGNLGESRVIYDGSSMIPDFKLLVYLTGSSSSYISNYNFGQIIGGGGLTNSSLSYNYFNIINLPDKEWFNITINYYETNYSNNPGSLNLLIPLLQGDVNGDLRVDSSDLIQVRIRRGQAVNSTNFIYDLDRDNAINQTDENIVNSSIGNFLPPL